MLHKGKRKWEGIYKVEILSLDDIFLHGNALLKCVEVYDNKKSNIGEVDVLNN